MPNDISPDNDQIPCADGETYTFRQWCSVAEFAVNQIDSRDVSTLRTAWRAGEDPSDYTEDKIPDTIRNV